MKLNGTHGICMTEVLEGLPFLYHTFSNRSRRGGPVERNWALLQIDATLFHLCMMCSYAANVLPLHSVSCIHGWQVTVYVFLYKGPRGAK